MVISAVFKGPGFFLSGGLSISGRLLSVKRRAPVRRFLQANVCAMRVFG